VLTSAPVLVGHKRVATFTPVDPYAALLAQAKHEYYSRLSSNNQLVAKHGKHVLNQFLQSAFVGSRVTKDHAWFAAGLIPTLGTLQPKISQLTTASLSTLSAVNSDITLSLTKDLPFTSSVFNRDFLAAKLNLVSYLLTHGGVKGATALADINPTACLGKTSFFINSAPRLTYDSNVRVNIFERSYGRTKGGVNPFRAHNTAVFVGNRLSRVHAYLSTDTLLPKEFSSLTKQSYLLQHLHTNTTTFLGNGRLLLNTLQLQDNYVRDLHPLALENVGANLWLTRAFKSPLNGANKPWALALLQQGGALVRSQELNPFRPSSAYLGLGDYSLFFGGRAYGLPLSLAYKHKNLNFF
jgi:hypothetical protein